MAANYLELLPRLSREGLGSSQRRQLFGLAMRLNCRGTPVSGAPPSQPRCGERYYMLRDLKLSHARALVPPVL